MNSISEFPELLGLRALVVCSDWPWPPYYAARIDALDRIHVLAELGLKVDVLVTAAQHHGALEVNQISRYVETCYVVQRRSGFFDMLGFLNTGTEYSRRRLADIQLTKKYDFVVLEGHLVSYVLKNPTLKSRYTILRVNNDERLFFFRLARSTRNIASLYYLLEALRFLRTWPALMKKIPVWMFSSAKEFERFKPLSRKFGAKSIFLPPRVDLSLSKIEVNSASKQVLFLGTLLMPNNREAVKWYLQNVHSRLLDIPDYVFCVAGHAQNTIASDSFFDLVRNTSRVKFIPNPVSTREIYEQSSVFVNPMRNGAGIKLKTVHALAAGLPVVATDVGAEGTCMLHNEEILQTNWLR